LTPNPDGNLSQGLEAVESPSVFRYLNPRNGPFVIAFRDLNPQTGNGQPLGGAGELGGATGFPVNTSLGWKLEKTALVVSWRKPAISFRNGDPGQ